MPSGSVARSSPVTPSTVLRRPAPCVPPHRMVTDRPFAEAKEQIGGFYLIDVPDLATAIELARLLPPEYTIEVRPTLGITV